MGRRPVWRGPLVYPRLVVPPRVGEGCRRATRPQGTQRRRTTVRFALTVSFRMPVVKTNIGFNPVWREELCLPFDCADDMKELIYVGFVVREDGKSGNHEPLDIYCIPLGCLELAWNRLTFNLHVHLKTPTTQRSVWGFYPVVSKYAKYRTVYASEGDSNLSTDSSLAMFLSHRQTLMVRRYPAPDTR